MDPYAAVQSFYSDTILPELMEYLGHEKTLEFIEIFGGKKIYIPSVQDLTDILRNAEIYERLNGLKNPDFTNVQFKLARRYNLDVEEVRQIFFEAKQKNEGINIEELDEKYGIKKIIDQTILQIRNSMIFDPKVNVRYKRVRSEIPPGGYVRYKRENKGNS